MEEICLTQNYTTWNIPTDTKAGEYRICHFGDSRDISDKIKPYTGISALVLRINY
jgi:hypothetical protein